MTPDHPFTRDIVLVGGGHTHALVLRMWGMKPLPGARLTLIDPKPTAPYSGMLPGFVAGHYERDDLDIDLVRLARFAGARLIPLAATKIEPVGKTIHVTGRPPIAFDVASIDVGITSDMPSLPGFADHAVPAKPLGPFARRWDAYRATATDPRVAIIGGGVAGCELAMAMAHALRDRADRQITVIDRSTALSALTPRTRDSLLQNMKTLGVTLREHTEVTAINKSGLTFSDGTNLEADFVTGAAGARPYDFLAASGLDTTDGYLTVDPRLRTSDHSIFAAGDCAHMAHAPRPKAGVFAVRQAPVLFANLRAAISSEPWKRYDPQRDYLKLISLGDQSALAEKASLPIQGRPMWRLKNRIDQTFMDKFRDLPRMTKPALPTPRARGFDEVAKPLCGGCGAKVGRDALSRIARTPARADITPLPGDDASLLTMGDTRQVLTTDHLASFNDDPHLMGRLAAIHALGDIWAMGAQPQAALAQIVLPRMTEALQTRTLTELMSGARSVLDPTGAAIIGGHTTMGPGPSVGFTITGLCETDPITLSGATPGDTLILTKPLGTGILLAAEMPTKARGQHILDMFGMMAKPQSDAAMALSHAHAMTDVTGFGLAGHLANICDASGTGAVIDLDAIPLYDGALALSQAGTSSSLFPANRAIAPELPATGKAALLFDPQTCGGLLATVPTDSATETLNSLKDLGYPAASVGSITAEPGLKLI